MEKKKNTRRAGCLEGIVRVSLNTPFRPKSMQYPISSINFLWNLSKTFVSVDFVAIRILPLLPARENDLLAPENFKVLFLQNQLVMPNSERI